FSRDWSSDVCSSDLGMAEHWTKAKGEIADLMNSIPKLVCSTTLKSADWNNSRLISSNVPGEIRKLKEEGGKDMYLFGSSVLSETLIREDLFDEYRICIAPVIAGRGRPLFAKGLPERRLKLVEEWKLVNGGIVVKYKPGMRDGR